MKTSNILIIILTFSVTLSAQFTSPTEDSSAVTIDASNVLLNPTAPVMRTSLGLGTIATEDVGAFAANVYPTGVGVYELGRAVNPWKSVATRKLELGGFAAETTLERADAGQVSIEGNVIRTEADVKYPVFVLTPPAGGDWTDFELKASRTNFATGTMSDAVYLYHSGGTIPEETGSEPDVWFTDSGHAASNGRRWNPLPSATSIVSSLTDVNSVVGSIIVVVDEPTLVNSSNDTDLVWAILWFNSTDFQKDAASRPIWRAITPTRYVKETFAP